MLYVAAVASLAMFGEIHKDKDYPAFERFIRAHRDGLPYKDELETLGRFATFKANLVKIEERNKKGQEKHGVTKFADLTRDEFLSKFTGAQPASEELKKKVAKLDHHVASNYSATAASIDWNAKGALTPIKNQGQCGSCWAFSATEQLESDYFLKYGTLKELAPQQIVSCDTAMNGCGGGNPISGWQYVNSYGGQDASKDYPYTSGLTQQTGTCSALKSDVTESVSSTIGYEISSSPADEPNMLKQIELSPMSIVADAELWQTYVSGVITASSGCGTTPDHAIQLTGYNAPGNYWIVRNSWGTDWGENGYVYVAYGSNVCGITTQAAITTPATVSKLHDA